MKHALIKLTSLIILNLFSLLGGLRLQSRLLGMNLPDPLCYWTLARLATNAVPMSAFSLNRKAIDVALFHSDCWSVGETLADTISANITEVRVTWGYYIIGHVYISTFIHYICKKSWKLCKSGRVADWLKIISYCKNHCFNHYKIPICRYRPKVCRFFQQV